MTKTDIGASDLLVRLQGILVAHGPLGVAVSGGVDSMTLAFIAHCVDPRSEIFHALSPAVPASATARVRRYAEAQGWRLRLIDAGEMRDPDYLRNPADRCYYCKSNLYRTVARLAGGTVASGTNVDDLGDFRPGLRAASEHGVVHPLVEAGIDKAGVRALARHLGLHDLQALPASPCLSSRVVTGIAIDAALLPLIDEAEVRIRALLGSAACTVRCRVRPGHLAVEIETDAVLDESYQYTEAIRTVVGEVFAGSGHSYPAESIVLEPYRRGSAFLRVSTAGAGQ